MQPKKILIIITITNVQLYFPSSLSKVKTTEKEANNLHSIKKKSYVSINILAIRHVVQ